MRLDEYSWSRNPRGLHCISIFQSPLEISRYTSTRMGWAKLLSVDTGFVDDAARLLASGITPLVRLYLGRYGAGPFTRPMQEIISAFVSVGVKWFEFYNEPNLGVEWPEGFDPTWEDQANVIRPLMDNWLLFAEYVISVGGYPGFIALAESIEPRYATTRWMDAFLNYLAAAHPQRFINILQNGGYVCTHPYLLNHFHQTFPGGPLYSARPPEAQRSQEPGWHFEYPYDPISQRDDPGRTVFGGTALTPYGDPNGLIAVGRLFNERCATLFGTQAVPVVGTEGGIWPFRGQVFRQDNRFPPYTETSQAEATVAMFEWIARVAPPWFFGVCLWKEDDYFNADYIAPAVPLLERIPTIIKPVPAIDVMGSGIPAPAPTPFNGPGPIHGEADYHMLLLAGGLTADWVFDTAQAYYNIFRPIITTLPELIGFIPNAQSLAVTLIVPADQVEVLRAILLEAFPFVWLDILIADDRERIRTILNQRVQIGLRFG